MNDKSVDILLSSYNGFPYIEEQIESLFNQTYRNITIFVRDDGSSDGTLQYLKKLSLKDTRIRLIDNQCGNLGPARSFLECLRFSDADYVMFCDQDDVWLKNKVEKSVKVLEQISNSKPSLVYTDLEVVDSSLKTIHKSFFERHKLEPTPIFSQLLVQNSVTGCTVIFNQKLRDLLLLKTPDFIVMHDWWVALVAYLYGNVGYVNEPLIKYRQHSNNAVGSISGLSLLKKRCSTYSKITNLYDDPTKQAIELAKFCSYVGTDGGLVPKKNEYGVLNKYLSFISGGVIARASIMLTSDYSKSTFIRNFIFKVFFIFFSKKITFDIL